MSPLMVPVFILNLKLSSSLFLLVCMCLQQHERLKNQVNCHVMIMSIYNKKIAWKLEHMTAITCVNLCLNKRPAVGLLSLMVCEYPSYMVVKFAASCRTLMMMQCLQEHSFVQIRSLPFRLMPLIKVYPIHYMQGQLDQLKQLGFLDLQLVSIDSGMHILIRLKNILVVWKFYFLGSMYHNLSFVKAAFLEDFQVFFFFLQD